MATTKKSKIDFKKVAIDTLVVGGTGAASQIVAQLIGDNNQDIVNYTLIGAGVILPEVVKNETVDNVGAAMLAVGAYRLAESQGLAGKLGIQGIYDEKRTIGAAPLNPGNWTPVRRVFAEKVNTTEQNNSNTVR